MPDSIQILKIGPIDNAPAGEENLYVPVTASATPAQLVVAANDTDGFDKINDAFPGAQLVCEPKMRPSRSNATVADTLPIELLELRFELALTIQDEHRLPPCHPLALRRVFLRNIGPFIAHVLLTELLMGWTLTANVDWARSNGEQRYEIKLSAIEDQDGSIVLTFSGIDGQAKVHVSPPKELGYLEEAFLDAYGLESVPEISMTGHDAGEKDLAVKYLLVGLTLATAIKVDLESTSASATYTLDNSDRIHVSVSADAH